MAPTTKFSRGAKVFAKVRGYPPWPARIDGCADETPNKMKYHVYFYGTGETAVVKNQDVFDYVENKMKYGKLKKHKNFTEAIQQIEAELPPEQKAALAALESADKTASPAPAAKEKESPVNVKEKKDSISDTTSKEKEDKSSAEPSESVTPAPSRRTSTTSKTPKSISASVASTSSKTPKTTPLSVASTVSKNPKSTPASVAKPAVKDNKRKLEAESTQDDPTPKKPNIATPQSTPAGSAEKAKDDKPPGKSSDGHSRSGRRIKPKKFTDFEDDEQKDTPAKDDDKKPKEVKRSLPRPKSLKGVEDSTEAEGDWYLLARGKEPIKIPLKFNRPPFEDNKKRSLTAGEWEDLVFEEARSLKKRIEKGEEFTDAEVIDYMERFTKVKANTVYVLRTPEEEVQYRKQMYDVESAILEIEVNIRDSLPLKGADPKKCLQSLDELKNLRVTALMLKKHPQIVQTMRKLRRYVGNPVGWNLSEEEMREFNSDAAKIRVRAEEIVNNFKTLFFLPTSISFWDHFSKELASFTAKTQHMSMEDLISIMTEPE